MDAPFSVFGVRHLSPGVSRHLLLRLEEIQPEVILIEGPADAGEILLNLAAQEVLPPVALLAYTTALPIETVLYPFAVYSPEYQAVLWGVRRQKTVRFIDLPTSVLLALREGKEDQEALDKKNNFARFHNELYEKLAFAFAGEDYESYWERNFEHNLKQGALQAALEEQSSRMRELAEDRESQDSPREYSHNLLREAHMRREIRHTLDAGLPPEKVFVLAGAYHTQGLSLQRAPMSDADLASLPRAETRLALMPYSYHRLSSRTGYGAGNKAPYYFEMMWQALEQGSLQDLPALYFSRVAGRLREQGGNASTASVIEAVRLARALAGLKASSSQPVLKDLHDAAATCFGSGSLAAVAEAVNLADIGTAMGCVPEGISQTPVQDDLTRELARLKLSSYKSSLPQELVLDLRENKEAKSLESAFLNLNRSILLHRLDILAIHFAKKSGRTQDKATWKETWTLQWTPEAEIELVEANLKGETLEIAAAFHLKEKLNDAATLSPAAQIIRQACEGNLTHIFGNALSTLQRLLVESADFKETAFAARELSLLLQYGDVRRFNLDPLAPLLQQIFLRAALLLVEAASCDDKAAAGILPAMNVMEIVSQEQHELTDTATWQQELQKLAQRDDLNPKLSGLAFALLLEHNLANEEDCAREVSRRLSPGIPADLGAGWFEGLAGRNRYALISRVFLWKELDCYVGSLPEEEFTRALVFLRRAFGGFDPAQKNAAAELLGELWGIGAEKTAELLQAELTQEENAALDDLNSFDF